MYNKVFLIGNLTRDPEMRFTTAGIPVTRFTIAVNRRFKSADNQEADFIRILTWRKLAEFSGEYLTKGKTVAVEGRLQVDSYEKEGKTRMTAEILADNVQILSKKTTEASDVVADNSSKEPAGEDEIPF